MPASSTPTTFPPTRKPTGSCRRRTDRRGASVLEREADPQRHLPVRDLAVGDMAARLGDLEPLDVADRLAGLGDGTLHGVVAARGRRAGELDELVDVMGHALLLGRKGG